MAEPICTCARCGHERVLSDVLLDAIADDAFHAAVQAATKLPPTLADATIRYMRLFGAIRPPAYAKLLADLTASITAGKFTHKRQEYQASPALWLSALGDVLTSTTVRLPLKAANGHGFLYAIAAAKAEQSLAAAELRREAELRHPGHRDLPPSASAPIAAPPTDARLRELQLDVRHWESLLGRRPDDSAIQQSLSAARSRLAAEFPPAQSTVV